MKKLLAIFCICVVFSILIYFFLKKDNQKQNLNTISSSVSTAKKEKQRPIQSVREETAEFVPYWTVDEFVQESANRYIYFGVSVNREGVDRSEAGYKQLNNFRKKITVGKKLLTIRMLNDEINNAVLSDRSSWKTIAEDITSIASANEFDGVVLDLEVSGLSFDSVVSNIHSFISVLADEVHAKHLSMGVLMFGDTYYRKRPYFVKEIAEISDEVLVMAYDFHKARGESGPNFPLAGVERYGYDFQTMVGDFLRDVPSEKLTIVFGMFGYDWQVDEKKRPIKPAQAMTLMEIQKKFLNQCEWQDCVVRRDKESAETEINYVKSEIIDTYASMYMHIVWFEDKQSVEKKKEFLKKQGIGSTGYWAWGYF